MRTPLVLLFALLAVTPASAQTGPDSVAYFNPARAFLWPQPFAHVPQTFEAQAVRFTTPTWRSGYMLGTLDLRVDETSVSSDNFNDTLRIGFYGSTPDGTPDVAAPLFGPVDLEFAELIPGAFNRIELPSGDFSIGGEESVWVTFELLVAGAPDRLVLTSGPKTDPPLFRAAARVAGEGWQMLTDTQFGAEYNFQVAAHFDRLFTPVAPAEGPGALTIRSVQPQPASGEAIVHFDAPAYTPVVAEVFDLLGRRVRSAEPVTGASHVRLDTADLPVGLYVVTVEADGYRATHPLVVAR